MWKIVNYFVVFIFVLALSDVVKSTAKRRLPIGSFFTLDEIDEEIAFRTMVAKMNDGLKYFELVPIVRYYKFDDSFTLEQLTCDILADGAVSIFGPSSRKSSGIVGSICHSLGIPHIVYSWRDEEWEIEKNQHTLTVNIFPETVGFSKAYADIVKEHGWNSFAVIYETGEGLIKLQDVLHITNKNGLGTPILPLGSGPDYRPLLKKVKLYNENNFILDCSLEKTIEVIRQAHEINLLGEDRSLFLSNLNTHNIDFQQLFPTKLNITSVRLSHPESLVRRAIYDWTSFEADQGRTYNVDRERVKNSMILIHDAVRLFTTALKFNNTFKDMKLPNGDCQIPRYWLHGKDIVDVMKMLSRNTSVVTESSGFITGRMDLDKFGDRDYFKLDITVLYAQFFHKLVSYNPEDGFTEAFEKEEIRDKISGSIQNKTFIVSSRLGAPFLSERVPENGEILEGNNRYMGYSLDLMQKLSEKLGFKYIIKLAPDKRYGQFNKKTKKWDGIIKQLIDGKADMGICDLTMTFERRQAVDFTVPFMALGLSILYSKPIKEAPNLFSFLLPFSLDVWMLTGVICLFITALLFMVASMDDGFVIKTTIGMIIVLFTSILQSFDLAGYVEDVDRVMALKSPNKMISNEEWENAHTANADNIEFNTSRNIWNTANRIWLAMGSLMGQGCDLLPKSLPMRLITGVWWFFALMMLNSYTANLAAFLTMSRIEESINDVEDLAEQTKVKYGIVHGGSSMSFFKDSNDSLYRKMWAAMENTQPSVFAGSNEEGMERVQKGRRLYAFLMESTILEYMTERHCDLMEVGTRFGDKFYGIALPLNSRYRTVISQELLRMSERGELYDLKMKWWKKNSGEACLTEIGGDDNELSIEQVGGVFIVLGVGLLVSYLIGICEFLWNVHKTALKEKISLEDAFKSEVAFVLRFWLKYKPAKMKTNASDIARRSSKASLKKWEIKVEKINKTD